MRSSKPPKTSKPGKGAISQRLLVQKMSEVISLREKVAQAELAARIFGQAFDRSAEEPGLGK
jgi:hypothetical protein